MAPDISLRVACAIKKQGKHLLSPLDSKAFTGLLTAVLFALEAQGCIRIEPAEPVHHGRILLRDEPVPAHLRAFYERARGQTVLSFFLDCTSEPVQVDAEIAALEQKLKEEETEQALTDHISRLLDAEVTDPLLFHLLEQFDGSRAIFTGPVRERFLQEELSESDRKRIETIPLLWMLRFVQ